MSSYNCSTTSSKKAKQIADTVALLKTVSVESRLKILSTLKNRPHCVCEIMKYYMDFSQSLVSHHLKDLKNANIVSDKKKGQYVYYSLTEKGKKITDIIFKLSL